MLKKGIGIGSRVRYLYGDKQTGTVVARTRAGSRSGEWSVRWDNDPYAPRLLPAWEENLELLDEGAQEQKGGANA